MDKLKLVCYGIAVAMFAIAGVCDFMSHHPKQGIIAELFAVSNFIIFFWR